MFSRSSQRGILPGFGLTIGVTLLYFVIIVALPLLAMLYKSFNLGWADFWAIVSSDRALATYRITVGAAALATVLNAAFGVLLAWVLVRYEFPGRRLLDAAVDLPFALPTAVAGLALVTVFPRMAGLANIWNRWESRLPMRRSVLPLR